MVSLFLSSSACGGLPLTHRALDRQIRQPPPLISASRRCRLSSVPSPPILHWRYPNFYPSRPRLLLSCPPSGAGCGAHEVHQHHHHQHHHGHEHSCELEFNGLQKAILRFAKAVGWVDLADLLRDHLQLCSCSMVLLLLSAACPYVLPARAAKLLQNAFISIAFPLIGVWIFAASSEGFLLFLSWLIPLHVGLDHFVLDRILPCFCCRICDIIDYGVRLLWNQTSNVF